MAGNHYSPSIDGVHKTYVAERRDRRADKKNRPPLPPKLFPLDEEIIANLAAYMDDHADDCPCDGCYDLSVLRMEGI